MIRGEVFRVGDKIYQVLVTLKGYDDWFIFQEINKLTSLKIIKKVRNASSDDMKIKEPYKN
jgi:hypothetical protein